LKKRFGESLKISVQVEEELRQHYIVPMALQMLVENAVKHNVVSKNKPLQINIFTEEDQLLIVQNNLQRKEINDLESTQVGLINIAQRYEFLSHKPIIIEANETYFTVKLPIIKLVNKEKLVVNDFSKESQYL
jgi:LytS/YehU family sensor histidine kinase